jgi:hypothetical protein
MREMKKSKVSTRTTSDDAAPDFASPLVGELASIDSDGQAGVFYPGNQLVPMPARTTVELPLRPGEDTARFLGTPVLLMFEGADPERPIIVGLLRDPIASTTQGTEATEIQVDAGAARDALVDGERMVIEAEREIVLRCGKSSLVLCRDGRVLIRGTNLISRSSGPNRIKGASISLN